MRNLNNLILSGFCILLLATGNACSHYSEPTPDKYKYISRAQTPDQYRKDSVILMKELNEMVAKNIRPFNSKHAHDSFVIRIYVDSILYSPDNKGVVVFIITKSTKVSSGKNSDATLKYFYGANYFYGVKDNLKRNINLFDYSSVSFINFEGYDDAKRALLEYCFRRRAADRMWNNREPRYNMDDIRFWKGEQFNTIFSDTSFIHFTE